MATIIWDIPEVKEALFLLLGGGLDETGKELWLQGCLDRGLDSETIFASALSYIGGPAKPIGRRSMVYAVSSGDYSDYSVSCIFERQEDAIAYAAHLNGIEVAEQARLGEIESLPYSVKRDVLAGMSEGARKADWGDGYRVEPFQFWPAGVVPHADA